MKILYILNSIIPSRRASSVHVMKMCQAFSVNGHQVTMLVRTISRREGENVYQYYGVKPGFKIKTLFLPVKGKEGLRLRCWRFLSGLVNPYMLERAIFKSPYGFRCWKFLSNLGDSSVLVYGRSPHGVYAATRKGFYSVYEAHHPPVTEPIHMLERAIFKSLYFKRLVVISDALKKEYLRLFPSLGEEKVLVAPDGADIPNDSGSKSHEINWSGRKGLLQIGYVGALYKGKGMEIILALSPLLKDVDFHVVGGDESDLKYWKEKIRQKNVHFHGFVPHGRLDSYYRKFDVLLAPFQKKVFIAPRDVTAGWNVDISRWTSPIKIFEYMAYGKPIIASNLPVIKEVLKNGGNALLCDPEDIESWKASILKLKESEALRKKLGSQAFEDLQNRYTWVKRAEKVLHGIRCG